MEDLKFAPPDFLSETVSYAEYKRKLSRWARITKVPKKQQAEVVVYHLEGHASGIQEKIDETLGDEIVDKEDGMKKLIDFLDTIYAEDDMTEAWSRYKKFVGLKRKDDEPVTEFIAEFTKEYTKAKASGCEFSDTVLAFNLLESCNLSEIDEKFVLTAVDFKKGKEEKNLLEQTKMSLKKFQSRDKVSTKEREKMKVDESLVANLKEALVSEGWKPPARRRSYSDSDANKIPKNSANYKGKKNPLGPEGKPLKCFRCNSEYHMLDRCDAMRRRKKSRIMPRRKERRRKRSEAAKHHQHLKPW